MPKELKDKIQSLNDEEKKAFEYFLQYVSVGSLIALRELKAFYHISEPKEVIRKLIEKGLIEQGNGCYSVSKQIRELMVKALRMSRI